jgi:precorrin-4 methylase
MRSHQIERIIARIKSKGIPLLCPVLAALQSELKGQLVKEIKFEQIKHHMKALNMKVTSLYLTGILITQVNESPFYEEVLKGFT